MSVELGTFNVQDLILAGDQGVCGGVNMADQATREVLRIVNGRVPVVTLWDTIHNLPYMKELKELGQNKLDDFVPEEDKSKDLIYKILNYLPLDSIAPIPAHGSLPGYYKAIYQRKSLPIDLTCQLVTKNQRAGERAVSKEDWVVFGGITDHPETNSVIKRLPPNAFTFIDAREVKAMSPLERTSYLGGLGIPKDKDITFLSQTTLSPGDLREMNEWLSSSFPRLKSEDSICIAMKNRWNSVAQMTESQMIDLLLVVGSKHSHNSQELKLKGEQDGLPAYSIDDPEEIDTAWFTPQVTRVGLTSGASVFPKYLEPVKNWFLERSSEIQVKHLPRTERKVTFVLPQTQINQIEDFIQRTAA